MQVTRECNNECIFCSNPQFECEFPLNNLKREIMRFKRMGITDIIMTGGEPTLVGFLPELIDFIIKQKIKPGVITNGVMLADYEIPKTLFHSGLRDINISIHSGRKDIADRLSQKKGHFRKALQGIRNAIDTGMSVSINSTINSLNCKRLPSFADFMTDAFPEVKHYVFNNLDPGKADGRLQSGAGKNPWIVARFTDFELELKRMVDVLLSNSKTFRIERVPLCYMRGFEEFSTETRKIVKGEKYICLFIEGDSRENLRIVNPSQRRTKAECCKSCLLGSICAGVQEEYVQLHGTDELYPVFGSPESIKGRVLKS